MWPWLVIIGLHVAGFVRGEATPILEWEGHAITREARLLSSQGWSCLPVKDIFPFSFSALEKPFLTADEVRTAALRQLYDVSITWLNASSKHLSSSQRDSTIGTDDRMFQITAIEAAEQFLRQFVGYTVAQSKALRQPRFVSWSAPLSALIRLTVTEYEYQPCGGDMRAVRTHTLWLNRAFGTLGPLRRFASPIATSKPARRADTASAAGRPSETIRPVPPPTMPFEQVETMLRQYDRVHVVAHFQHELQTDGFGGDSANANFGRLQNPSVLLADDEWDLGNFLHDPTTQKNDIFSVRCTETGSELHDLPSARSSGLAQAFFEKPSSTQTAEAQCANHSDSIAPFVRVMSYNIWNVNDWPGTRRAVLMEQLRDSQADVVALQEVRFVNRVVDSPPGSFHQIEDIVQQVPQYAHFVFQPAHTEVALRMGGYGQQMLGTHQDEGVAILSKHPIVSARFIALSRNMSDGDDAHQRVVLHARINLGARKGFTDVYSTHFGLSPGGRARNAVELRNFITETNVISQDTECRPPVFVMGDFNAECQEESIKLLKTVSRPKSDLIEPGLRSESNEHVQAFRDAQLEVFERTQEDLAKEEPTKSASSASSRLSLSDICPGSADMQNPMYVDEAWTFSTLPNATRKVIDFVLFRAGDAPLHALQGGPLTNPHGIVVSDHRALVFDFVRGNIREPE